MTKVPLPECPNCGSATQQLTMPNGRYEIVFVCGSAGCFGAEGTIVLSGISDLCGNRADQRLRDLARSLVPENKALKAENARLKQHIAMLESQLSHIKKQGAYRSSEWRPYKIPMPQQGEQCDNTGCCNNKYIYQTTSGTPIVGDYEEEES